MTQEHPVHPSRNLIQQWLSDYLGCTVSGELSDSELYLATQAARWGADQELEACCKLLELSDPNARESLCAARRPQPPSLTEQAKQALGRFFANEHTQANQMTRDFEIIRRALESLPD